jgi:hypothetical protein
MPKLTAASLAAPQPRELEQNAGMGVVFPASLRMAQAVASLTQVNPVGQSVGY